MEVLSQDLERIDELKQLHEKAENIKIEGVDDFKNDYNKIFGKEPEKLISLANTFHALKEVQANLTQNGVTDEILDALLGLDVPDVKRVVDAIRNIPKLKAMNQKVRIILGRYNQMYSRGSKDTTVKVLKKFKIYINHMIEEYNKLVGFGFISNELKLLQKKYRTYIPAYAEEFPKFLDKVEEKEERMKGILHERLQKAVKDAIEIKEKEFEREHEIILNKINKEIKSLTKKSMSKTDALRALITEFTAMGRHGNKLVELQEALIDASEKGNVPEMKKIAEEYSKVAEKVPSIKQTLSNSLEILFYRFK